MKWYILSSGGTIEGLFSDIIISDVVHGNKIEGGTSI